MDDGILANDFVDDEVEILPNNAEDNQIDNANALQQQTLQDYQSYTASHTANQIVLPIDYANSELFSILLKAGAPLYLFDNIQVWAEKYGSVLKKCTLQNRKACILRMEKKLYGRYTKHMRPKIEAIKLSSGREAPVTTFLFRMGLMSKLMDSTLMTSNNLLIDVNNPFRKHADNNDCYGEVNTGRWYSDAYDRFCGGTNKTLLIPIALYIDGMSADKMGNISLEPVVAVPLIFKRSIRNKPISWFTLGYIKSLKKEPKPKGRGKKKNTRLTENNRGVGCYKIF